MSPAVHPPTVRAAARRFCRFALRLSLFAALFMFATPAFAQAALGQGLLDWVSNNILPTVGLFAIVVSAAVATFNPMLARGIAYTALMVAVMFFLISRGQTLMTYIKQ